MGSPVAGWLGGLRGEFDHGPCILSPHRAFLVTPAVADQ